MAKVSGTKEWSVASDNCVLGCSHQCRYCYARSMAFQYRRIQDANEWGTTYNHVRKGQITKRRDKVTGGRVMFPTTHDITPEHLDACLVVIQKNLQVGNQLLITSKPHLDCIQQICEHCFSRRDQILFRFTIGACDQDILHYWEPGAPTFLERTGALRLAYSWGFQTSVSCEPLLDSENVLELIDYLTPWTTDSIWIGKMNQVRKRCIDGTNEEAIQCILGGQTDEMVLKVYHQLKDHPLIKWKESYKEVVGLELPQEIGLDV